MSEDKNKAVVAAEELKAAILAAAESIEWTEKTKDDLTTVKAMVSRPIIRKAIKEVTGIDEDTQKAVAAANHQALDALSLIGFDKLKEKVDEVGKDAGKKLRVETCGDFGSTMRSRINAYGEFLNPKEPGTKVPSFGGTSYALASSKPSAAMRSYIKEETKALFD